MNYNLGGKRKDTRRAGEMTQWVRVMTQALQNQHAPSHSQILSPCPMTTTHTVACMLPYTYKYIIICTCIVMHTHRKYKGRGKKVLQKNYGPIYYLIKLS